jgi:uncharacterized RDD family membrane protein YckC
VVTDAIGLGDITRELDLIGNLFITIDYAWILFFVYYTVMTALFAQTIGKASMRIAVADENGGRCSGKQAVYRSVLLVVDFALGGLVGLLSILDSETNQRVGDRVAGTVVVRTRE